MRIFNIIRRYVFIFATSMIGTCCIIAQDTVHINIQTAEKLFLEKNLLLMAEKYNIDIVKAEIIQAKLFDNPNLSASIDIYNPDNSKWFDASKSTGQYIFAIEQIIRLGGKRNKAVEVAKAGAEIAENQFYNLLRTLRFSLNSVFYDVYYTLRSLQAFDTQIDLLNELQNDYKELEARKVIPLSELIRIRSLLYNLQSDKLELQNTFNEKQSELQLLLQNNQVMYIPVVENSDFIFKNPTDFLLPDLVNEAKLNRIDLIQVRNEVNLQKRNYYLQKSTSIPDLTIGGEYDKRGGFADNLFSLTFSFDLPFLNRNQGNIKAAKAAILQSEIMVEHKQSEVENEVGKTWLKAVNAAKTNQFIDKNFESDLQTLLQNITENFRKKNISLLEFTDFHESYRDNIIKINQIHNQQAQAMEELRFVAGTNL